MRRNWLGGEGKRERESGRGKNREILGLDLVGREGEGTINGVVDLHPSMHPFLFPKWAKVKLKQINDLS